MASLAWPVEHFFRQELGVGGVNALQQRHASHGIQFLQLTERPPEIAADLYARMRRIVALSECKGMGMPNALALETLKITRLEELAREDPLELASKLREAGRRVRLEEVKMWIREANRRKVGGKTIMSPSFGAMGSHSAGDVVGSPAAQTAAEIESV